MVLPTLFLVVPARSRSLILGEGVGSTVGWGLRSGRGERELSQPSHLDRLTQAISLERSLSSDLSLLYSHLRTHSLSPSALTAGLAMCNQHTMVLFLMPIIGWVLFVLAVRGELGYVSTAR